MVKKQLQLMAAELKDEVVPDGIELKDGRKEHDFNKNIVMETSDGKQVVIHRFIDVEKAFVQMDDKRKKERKYEQIIQSNKKARLLDTEALKNAVNVWHGKDKQSKENKDEHKLVDSEIELTLVSKYAVEK